MSRVLVTGGAGFIGSHVVDRLIAAGHEPVVLDVRPSPHHTPREATTVLADVCDLAAVRRAMRGCDAVAHLAAAADVGEVEAEPATAEQLNTRGTLNVLQAARELGVRRVVYASTIWVYSGVEAESADEDTPLPPPAHLYTATKLAGELYCRSYGELYGLETTILRFGIPYGPRARSAAVLPIFVGKALSGEPLTVAGTGEQTRRFVYVEDLAEGVALAIDAPAAGGRTYNLVGDEDVSVKQIATTVRDLVGDAEVVHVPGRNGDFRGVAVSSERAECELGWKARTCFREGAGRYVDWHVRQAEAPAPEPVVPVATKPVRENPLRLGNTLVVAIVALFAGAIAGALARVEALSDPASFIGTMVLLGVPVALLAGVDWARDRRRSGLVVVAMLGGALAIAVAYPSTVWVVHAARQHAWLLLGAATAALAVAGAGMRAAGANER
jgi:UDP-glucose 4-epimerase